MDFSAFCQEQILTAGFAAGIVGNFVASIGYDVSKCKIGDLSSRLREILLTNDEDQNHDLLRAVLSAQSHALVAVCDTCLSEDYQTEPSLWRALMATIKLPSSLNAEVAVIVSARHKLAQIARQAESLSMTELAALVGPSLEDVNGLLSLGREINACGSDKFALRKLAIDRTRNVLEFSAGDQVTLPAALLRRFEQHWFEYLRVAFRETLKGNQFSKARRAFELDVLSALSGVPQTLADIETKLAEQDQKLEAVFSMLVLLNRKLNDWAAQGQPAAAEFAQWQTDFQASFAAWQAQLNRIESDARQAAENSAATLSAVNQLSNQLKQGGFMPVQRVSPVDWRAYHQECIDEWNKPRWELQKRFVRLTLQFVEQDEERGNTLRPDAQNQTYQGLDELMAARKDFPVLVVLGDPGCGKSTLLRHLQLVHSQQSLRDGLEEISVFFSLDTYRGEGGQTPRAWLRKSWEGRYDKLPSLAECLRHKRVLLLLDALNEMKPAHKLEEMMADWRDFAQELVHSGQHRIVFTCREDDYQVLLDCEAYQVPQVLALPLRDEQMQEFVEHYAEEHATTILEKFDEDNQLRAFYRNPFFLKLLCGVVKERQGDFPQGRASLFTRYVWDLLERESKKQPWLTSAGLLHKDDQTLLTRVRDKSRVSFALPENGLLIPQLRTLAFGMQQKGGDVTLSASESRALLNDPQHADAVLAAGLALSLLDKTLADDDISQWHYKFFHQLLQEYFAARQFVRAPNWLLVQQDWSAENLRAEYETLIRGAALPALKQSHWFETTIIAAPMAANPNEFIRQLRAVNPVLAARCALSAEIELKPALKVELQDALQAMLLDETIDVRARQQAGEQLGWLGDPRFTRNPGKHGNYLLPPFATIPAGKYPLGLQKSDYADEVNKQPVKVNAFRLAVYPVTNAEFALFIAAGGYQNEHWWDTPAALDFLHTGAAEERREGWRQTRKILQDNHWTEERLRDMSEEYAWNEATLNAYINALTFDKVNFEDWLREVFQDQDPPIQPNFWEDARFNHPSQPVVGISWYEARAYCNWLTATVGDGRKFTLPTEPQFEAAARGRKGWLYPYQSNEFNREKGNTVESRLRRTTPVGIFANATPEGVYDLSGNVWTWTLSLYRDYPYDSDDGREDVAAAGNRVLRGGSWDNDLFHARAVGRDDYVPAVRSDDFGLRIVEIRPPSP